MSRELARRSHPSGRTARRRFRPRLGQPGAAPPRDPRNRPGNHRLTAEVPVCPFWSGEPLRLLPLPPDLFRGSAGPSPRSPSHSLPARGGGLGWGRGEGPGEGPDRCNPIENCSGGSPRLPVSLPSGDGPSRVFATFGVRPPALDPNGSRQAEFVDDLFRLSRAADRDAGNMNITNHLQPADGCSFPFAGHRSVRSYSAPQGQTRDRPCQEAIEHIPLRQRGYAPEMRVDGGSTAAPDPPHRSLEPLRGCDVRLSSTRTMMP